MPISGAKYRFKKGSDTRLAFKDNEVVEAKNMKSGKVHSQKEFAEDRKEKRMQRSATGRRR